MPCPFAIDFVIFLIFKKPKGTSRAFALLTKTNVPFTAPQAGVAPWGGHRAACGAGNHKQKAPADWQVPFVCGEPI
jgi:hypothetical protein